MADKGEKIPLFNPLNSDFTVKYDIEGDGKPKQFTAKAQEITWHDPVIAKHIKKHLATAIVNERGPEGHNWPLSIKKAREEIEVDLDE